MQGHTRWFVILSLYFSVLNILPRFPSSSWFKERWIRWRILIVRSTMICSGAEEYLVGQKHKKSRVIQGRTNALHEIICNLIPLLYQLELFASSSNSFKLDPFPLWRGGYWKLCDWWQLVDARRTRSPMASPLLIGNTVALNW